ncbi:MAG: GNAT family N-acetyltransferase [Oscillochloris sp.]|nr:GNAT family N-acetyltransferase [Oscillochloris sp.]
MEFVIRPMDGAAARRIATWRYESPYDYYNLIGDPLVFVGREGEAADYFQILCNHELVGFCCFGAEGQVPGGDYSAPGLDIGIGIRPDLTGRGQGLHYLAAVTDFAERTFAPPTLRLTVADWNTRAIRLYSRAGFVISAEFHSQFSRQLFLMMHRAVQQ